MKFLRTVSTRRLLALIAGVLIAGGAGTAIAVAESGSGPKPPAKRLARAIHDAASAPQVSGITADITFTDHLIDSTDLQGKDPILNGTPNGRLWISGDGQVRLELQSDNGTDAQAVVGQHSFWVYDPGSNTTYEGSLPADHGKTKGGAATHDQVPSVARIQSELANLAKHLNISGAMPSDVAGQPAYTVRVSPKHDGGLLGAGELAWDASHGVPLRFAVYAQHQSSPVLELKATGISYGSVDPSVFAISPPAGAKVVKVSTLGGGQAGAARHTARDAHRGEVGGVAAVAKRVPFKLVSPAHLVGLPRRAVTLLDWGGHPAALVAYGQNLGGVAVIEQAAEAQKAPSGSSSGNHQGLSLPTVSINGATGQQLDTALGTMVRFTRAGVSYVVIGSVPPAAADAAARAL